MNENNEKSNRFIQRKIFFLYPHTIIKDIYKDIIHQGYDAYLIDNHNIILHLLKKFPQSILYINIDGVLKDNEWIIFIKQILANPATNSTNIGIMTDQRLNKKYLSRKYIVDIGIKCGFISFIPNIIKLREVIFKVLRANEAEGRRKYVRARCRQGGTINFKFKDMVFYGDLIDISLAGAACMFDKNLQNIPASTFLENMQLKLHGVLTMVSGKIHAVREVPGKGFLFIILFKIDTMRPKGGENINTYICRYQEEFIKRELADYTETSIEPDKIENSEDDVHAKPDELFTQEVVEELEILNEELKEIKDIINDRNKND